MNHQSYKKATPLIKSLEELDVQIDTISKTTQIKIDVSGTIVLINSSQFTDQGMSTVREAILKTLKDKKESLEKELSLL